MLIGLVVVNFTIKPLVARARPWLVIESFVNLVPEHDPNSFPSGHTNAAFAFALAVCMSAPKKWMKVSAVCAAAVMGLSRLYVHSADTPALRVGLKNSSSTPRAMNSIPVLPICVYTMGLSRLYVGVHFPSDVLAGAVIGSLCGLLGACHS